MFKKNNLLFILLLVGSVGAMGLFGWTLKRESKKPLVLYEVIRQTGKSFDVESLENGQRRVTTYVEVLVKDRDGRVFTMLCPCIQGSACYPQCVKDESGS